MPFTPLDQALPPPFSSSIVSKQKHDMDEARDTSIVYPKPGQCVESLLLKYRKVGNFRGYKFLQDGPKFRFQEFSRF